MSNIQEVLDQLKAILEGQDFTPDERSEIAGLVMHTVHAPGVVWSPEDFNDYIDGSFTEEQKKQIREEAYETLVRSDLGEGDLEYISSLVDIPMARVMKDDPIDLRVGYSYQSWENVLQEASLSASDQDSEPAGVSWEHLPTRGEVADKLKDLERRGHFVFVDQVADSYELFHIKF